MLRVVRPLKHDPAKSHCLLNLVASHTNVLEETPYTWPLCQHAYARPATGVARARWDKDIPAGYKHSTNPEDAGPIVRHPMGLPSLDSNQDLEWDS
jgi:hypothetical protein